MSSSATSMSSRRSSAPIASRPDTLPPLENNLALEEKPTKLKSESAPGRAVASRAQRRKGVGIPHRLVGRREAAAWRRWAARRRPQLGFLREWRKERGSGRAGETRDLSDPNQTDTWRRGAGSASAHAPAWPLAIFAAQVLMGPAQHIIEARVGPICRQQVSWANQWACTVQGHFVYNVLMCRFATKRTPSPKLAVEHPMFISIRQGDYGIKPIRNCNNLVQIWTNNMEAETAWAEKMTDAIE